MTPQNDKPLRLKVGVITGASRGIGLAMAERFAEAGCDLALCARNTRFLLSDFAGRYPVQVLVNDCDVRSESSVREFFAAIQLRFGRIDILVNNAGSAGPSAKIEQMALGDWRDAIDTNLTGTFLCTRAALPLMRPGSVIVNNLSMAARTGFSGESAYVAAKHGAKGFTETLRAELRERSIRVIALYPGPTDTDIWNQFWPSAPRERMISPDTVALATLNAVTLPENAAMEELVVAPAAGAL